MGPPISPFANVCSMDWDLVEIFRQVDEHANKNKRMFYVRDLFVTMACRPITGCRLETWHSDPPLTPTINRNKSLWVEGTGFIARRPKKTKFFEWKGVRTFKRDDPPCLCGDAGGILHIEKIGL